MHPSPYVHAYHGQGGFAIHGIPKKWNLTKSANYYTLYIVVQLEQHCALNMASETSEDVVRICNITVTTRQSPSGGTISHPGRYGDQHITQ